MEDRKYPIELEVITPLSVGAGNDNEWVKGLDFVQKDGKVYVIDMQKVAAVHVDTNALTALFLKSDDLGISQLLGNKIDSLSRYVFDLPVKTDNNIKTFLRTQFFDKPVVAGSSIKGSVRSALFHYLRTNEEKNEDVFGTMKDGTDFMRFIRVGDVEMPATVLVNTKLFNLRKEGTEWLGGWKHLMNKTTGNYNPVGFNTLYECVAPGEKGLGNISLVANAFSLLEKYGSGKSSYAGKKRTLLNEPVSSLFNIINNVTRGYLQKERAFFLKYNADRSDEVLDCIDSLLSMIPADGSCCLLKMSAGVGFHSITGDWQFEDYDKTGQWTDPRRAGKKRYKSRKVAEYNHRLQLMGFVKLRAMSQTETAQIITQQEENHHAILRQQLASIHAREEARRQAEDAKVQREKERAEELRKREAFDRLMTTAKELYAANQWDEAIAKAQEAISIDPAQTETATLIEQCESAKRLKAFAEQEQGATTAKFSKPLEQVLQGVASIGNLIGTTGKWLKINGKTFGNDEMTILTAVFRQLPAREQQNLRKKLKDLEKAIGKEWTARFVSQI